MCSPYSDGGEDVEKIPGGVYPPVCVETATPWHVRVGVASSPRRRPRVRGTHGYQLIRRPAVAEAVPDGADTGVEVQ
jgi:hypothetical protein